MGLYAVLGIDPAATPEEIRRAYRRRARELHPDVVGPGFEEEYRAATHAFEVLSDPEARTRYDAGVEAAQERPQATSEALLHWASPWEVAANIALLACGPLWLLGASEGGATGEAVIRFACQVFIFAGAPWAVVLIIRKNGRAVTSRERADRVPRSLTLTAVIAIALVYAGLTVGGELGETVVYGAGLVLLLFGVLSLLALFMPVGWLGVTAAVQRSHNRSRW